MILFYSKVSHNNTAKSAKMWGMNRFRQRNRGVVRKFSTSHPKPPHHTGEQCSPLHDDAYTSAPKTSSIVGAATCRLICLSHCDARAANSRPYGISNAGEQCSPLQHWNEHFCNCRDRRPRRSVPPWQQTSNFAVIPTEASLRAEWSVSPIGSETSIIRCKYDTVLSHDKYTNFCTN